MAKKKKTFEELLQEALVPLEEQPYEIPKNWVWSRMGNIGEYLNGKAFKKYEWSTKGRPIIRIQDLTGSNKNPNYFEGEVDKRYEVKKGDFLISWSATLGAYIWKGMDAVLNQHIFKVNSYINKLFHYYIVKKSINELYSRTHGSGMVHVTKGTFNSIRVPLPPIAEQERIVNKIESMFSKMDRAKELIVEAREDFQNRKAAILAKAFRGELTKKWREEHKDVESAEELLKKVEEEKSKVKKKKKKVEVDEVIEAPYELPEKWKWVRLRKITYKFQYGSSKKSQNEGKIPVLRMGNLKKGILDWKDLVYTSNDDEIDKFNLEYNDILFNRTNSPELVGKTSIYKGEMSAIFAGYLIRVRVYQQMNPDYINYYMNSIYAKAKCYEVKTDGVSQSNINSQKLGKFEIPIPPQEEQKEIVRILDKLLQQESKVEELTKLEDQIELIKKSILNKAFRGELRTNDPEEESALELLKEVLREKAK